MKAIRQPVGTARLHGLLKPVFEELGKTDSERLRRVLPRFTNGQAQLSVCLQDTFPNKSLAEALAPFRKFQQVINDACKTARVGLVFRNDSSKRHSATDRKCWFEGEHSTRKELEAFTQGGINALARLDSAGGKVENLAIVKTGDELASPEPPIVRVFVSYATKDSAAADKFLNLLEQYLKAADGFRFEVWRDVDGIRLHEKLHPSIQQALDESHIGILLLSPAFLSSKYIREHELPHFKEKKKPFLMVELRGSFEGLDLQGLDDYQRFALPAATGKKRVGFKNAGIRQEEFVSDFFAELTKSVRQSLGVDRLTAGGEALSSTFPEGNPVVRIKQILEMFCGKIAREASLGVVIPSQAAVVDLRSLEQQAVEAGTFQPKAENAFEILETWACDPTAPPFFAVLGEYGIGKTTTLMRLTRNLLARRKKDPAAPLPIFVDLRHYYAKSDHPDNVPTLEEILGSVIANNWDQKGAPALTPGEIVDAVQTQGALIIFDGLDEKIVHLKPNAAQRFIRELWRVLPPSLLSDQSTDPASKPRRPPGKRPGKMILSCRSHFFKDIASQNAMLAAEGRDGIRLQDYRACIVLPFNEEQIRAYLAAVLKDADAANRALELFASVHNLNELAQRPYLLSLMTEQIGQLEERKARGETVLGVTLYDLLVEKWLHRDDGKHHFAPEHKLVMMEALALDLWRDGAREWPWAKVNQWLGRFLVAHPEINVRYQSKDPELLNEDFRAATFVLRPDTSKESFRFAHTSLQEYFLSRRLFAALEEGDTKPWQIPMPSLETLDFLGQLLRTRGFPRHLTGLNELLACGEAIAARTAFRYWLLAVERDYPEPMPDSVNLAGMDLAHWKIQGRSSENPLVLPRANLAGARLDYAELQNVQMINAVLSGASMLSSRFENVDLSAANLEGTDCSGATFRQCVAEGLRGETTSWYDVDWIHSRLTDARLSEAFSQEGTLVPSPHDPPSAGAFSPDFGGEGGFDQREKPDEGEQPAVQGFNARGMGAGKSHPAEDGQWSTNLPTDVPSSLESVLRTGHSGKVTCCAWSPDGRRLLSGSLDNTLRLWDAQSGQSLRTLEGHQHWVMACAWSPDGRRLLSGSLDNTLRLWDAQSGQSLRTLEGHQHGVMACAWSPDGRRLLSGSLDKTLRLWDAQSGQSLRTLEGHQHGVNACAWSPDGRRLLSGSLDKTLRLWDAQSGQSLRTLEGHQNEVNACAWSPDGRRLLSGSFDNTLRLWDAQSGQSLRTLEGHQHGVNACAWSPDGRRLLSGSLDNTLRLWDAQSGQCLRTLEGHQIAVMACAWSPDGRRLLSGSFDNTLRLWDAQSGQYLRTLEGHQNWVMACAWSPDGRRLLSGSSDNTLRLWDAQSGQHLRTLEGHQDWVKACAWSPDGRRLLSGSLDKTLRVWDAQSGQCLRILEGHQGGVNACAWSPDGRRLLSGSLDDTLWLWDAQSGQCLRTLEGHQNEVKACAWSPDGRRLLSGSLDNTLRLWDAQSGQSLRTLEGHQNWAMACAWSPDGRRLLSGSLDDTLRLWDAQSGQSLRTLEGHQNGVRACAWSPDGRRLLSGSDDNTLRLWDAHSGQCLRTLEGHQNGVMDCAWSPDGRRLLSGSDDNTLRLWDAQSGAPIFCSHLLARRELATIAGDGRVLWVSPGAWRYLGWRFEDPHAGRTRILPAEFFGPLPQT